MEESAIYRITVDTLTALPRDVAYVGLILVLLAAARFVKDLLTSFSIRQEMSDRDNPAVGLSMAGYYVAVILVCLGPLTTPLPTGEEAVPLWEDLLLTVGYTALGILLLNIARELVDRVLLRDFSTTKEIVQDRNVGTAAVEMGAYVASGLMIAGTLQGQGGGIHTALVFFALGQLGLVIYGALYRLVCRYDVHAEIEKDNVAAGVAFGLNLVAIGLVTMRAVGGDFVSWERHLGQIGIIYAIGVVFLLVSRFLVDHLLLPGVRLHTEIAQDRNINAAWVEGVVVAGLAGLLVTVL